MSNIYGRQVVLPLTNKSGGGVVAGDVVIIDTTNNDAFTTTTSGAFTGGIGIAQETIASNATGRVLMEGYAALVNVNASVTRGNFGKTHTVVKQATDAGASRTVGTFCQFLTGGTTPDARIYPPDLNASSGSVATDAIWDAAGDLAVGTGADAAAKLSIGATGKKLEVLSGTAAWKGVRGARVTKNADQTLITANTNVTVTWQTAIKDDASWLSSNAIIVPVTGWYHVYGSIYFQKDASDISISGGFDVNAAVNVLYVGAFGGFSTTAAFCGVSGCADVYLTASDSLTAIGLIVSGTVRTIRQRSTFGATLIGAAD